MPEADAHVLQGRPPCPMHRASPPMVPFPACGGCPCGLGLAGPAPENGEASHGSCALTESSCLPYVFPARGHFRQPGNRPTFRQTSGGVSPCPASAAQTGSESDPLYGGGVPSPHVSHQADPSRRVPSVPLQAGTGSRLPVTRFRSGWHAMAWYPCKRRVSAFFKESAPHHVLFPFSLRKPFIFHSVQV